MIELYGNQDLIVVLLVLGAAAWLARRWWVRRKRGSCNCDGCPVAERGAPVATPLPAATNAGLLTIETPRDAR